MNLRLPQQLAETLKQEAKPLLLSLNQYIVMILESRGIKVVPFERNGLIEPKDNDTIVVPEEGSFCDNCKTNRPEVRTTYEESGEFKICFNCIVKMKGDKVALMVWKKMR